MIKLFKNILCFLSKIHIHDYEFFETTRVYWPFQTDKFYVCKICGKNKKVTTYRNPGSDHV